MRVKLDKPVFTLFPPFSPFKTSMHKNNRRYLCSFDDFILSYEKTANTARKFYNLCTPARASLPILPSSSRLLLALSKV